MNPSAKPFVPNPNAATFVPRAQPAPVRRRVHHFTPSFPVSTTPRDGLRVFSMDVECIATGNGHAARSPCSVVIVDYWLNIVLDCIIKPAVPVFNYLTEITGFSEGELDDGEPLEEVIEKVKALLGPDALLVGQSVKSDIAWMDLKEKIDFHSVGELSTAFGVFKPHMNRWSYFSLEHEAMFLLGIDLSSKGYHDPADDAAASMELYKLFVEYGDSHTSFPLFNARQMLSNNPVRPSFAKRCNYLLHGVCMAGYTPSRCTCGDPSLAVLPAAKPATSI